MSPKRVKVARKPRGARKWILAELRGLPSGDQLSTSQIAKRIGRAAGKRYHKNSVYNGLRLLVRQGDIAVARQGHKKTYRLASSDSPARRPSPSAETVLPSPVLPGPTAAPAAAPNKLAVGEILLLHIGEEEVHTATNRRGRLVLEKHRRP